MKKPILHILSPNSSSVLLISLVFLSFMPVLSVHATQACFLRRAGLYLCRCPMTFLRDNTQNQVQLFLKAVTHKESKKKKKKTPPCDIWWLLLLACSKPLWEMSLYLDQTQHAVTSLSNADSKSEQLQVTQTKGKCDTEFLLFA